MGDRHTDLQSMQTEEDVGRFLYAIENAPVQRWPYHHFTAADLLDPAVIEELRSQDLSRHLGSLKDQRKTAINSNRYFLSLLPDDDGGADGEPFGRLRRLFGSNQIAHSLMRRFIDVLTKRVRLTEAGLSVIKSLDLIEDRSGYRLPPHTDGRQKLLTLILYLDDEPAGHSLGTSIYAPKPDLAAALLDAETAAQRDGQSPHRNRKDFIRVATVPHRANTALCFAPTKSTYHGVEPVTAAGARRLLLQFHLLVGDSRVLLT